MIHSMAGGKLQEIDFVNLAKVEIIDGVFKGEIYWYITEIVALKENDFVYVPFGKNNTLLKAKVLRIDKNVSTRTTPIPFKRLKKISSIALWIIKINNLFNLFFFINNEKTPVKLVFFYKLNLYFLSNFLKFGIVWNEQAKLLCLNFCFFLEKIYGTN